MVNFSKLSFQWEAESRERVTYYIIETFRISYNRHVTGYWVQESQHDGQAVDRGSGRAWETISNSPRSGGERPYQTAPGRAWETISKSGEREVIFTYRVPILFLFYDAARLFV